MKLFNTYCSKDNILSPHNCKNTSEIFEVSKILRVIGLDTAYTVLQECSQYQNKNRMKPVFLKIYQIN